jgi:ABC-type molybdenum transport system ATPase subunit/photorepair protein PhrA
MITSIKLKCFRKHEDLSLNLTEGLQVFRGSNEAGKTSVIEGVAYALFGSKALRNSLSDVVTWGHKDGELKAEVVLLSGGTSYMFSRGKSGAEVVVDGKPYVTGQTEVSSFAADLLGTDANTAAQLMMAGQGGLRGVLDQGPKATSALIEGLSNLDLIEEIIEKAQTNLQVGSTAIFADRLKGVQAALSDFTTIAKPVEPVVDTALLALKKEQVAEARGSYVLVSGLLEAEQKQRDAAKLHYAELLQLADHLTETEGKLKDVVILDPVETGYIEQAIAAAEQHEAVKAEWESFLALPKVECVQLDSVKFLVDLTDSTANVTSANEIISAAKTLIKVLEPQLAHDTTCPACGQDTAHLEHVKAKQAKVKEDLDLARASIVVAQVNLEEWQPKESALRRLEQVNLDLRTKASRLKYVEIDTTVTPADVKWIGPSPDSTGASAETLREDLKKARSHNSAIDAAKGKASALEEVIVNLKAKQDLVQGQVQALDLVSDEAFEEIENESNFALNQLSMAEGIVSMMEMEIETAQKTYQDRFAVWERGEAAYSSLKAQAAQLEADIETIEFNNLLVKKLRAARPIIGNKLWSLVLATVSTLFSQMRGETSIVTKGKDGFAVNGKPVESLSGSTLDILGLAIRCALIKTFVPDCPFIVLDEPSASMDENRSALLLGFVASSGFQQVIMVTHDETSEILATNLVTL